MTKIKYETERNGELKEFPLTSQTIVLPNGTEMSLRYDHIRQALTITKISDGDFLIQPGCANQIYVK